MGDILISLLTICIIGYLFYLIIKNRHFIFRYISSTGGNEPVDITFSKPGILLFTIFNIVIAVLSFICIMHYYHGSWDAIRVCTSIVLSLILVLMLWIFAFMIVICIKEIVSMKDNIITTIIICSFISFTILLIQVLTDSIEYADAFVIYSCILYVMNILSIGRIVSIILRRKVSVKSLWFISIINITFIIMSLTNIAYQLKNVYRSGVYSRDLVSWGDSLYFVVITFFTVGYGDLYPTCELSKILSMVIIITGFVFTAIFISAALSATIEHFSERSEK